MLAPRLTGQRGACCGRRRSLHLREATPALLPALRALSDTHAVRSGPPVAAVAAEQAAAPALHTSPPRVRALVKPHVLAPAGGWPQLRAAVACGADAVYFGLDGVNARSRAENFTLAELPSLMAELHAAGVKGYVAMNILLFDSELDDAEMRLRAIYAAGADAVIVQDVGLAELAGRCAPGLRVHASTQQTVTSSSGAAFASSLGCERVVAARELSVGELATLSDEADVEVEAFVHGALCVSYSGQCLSSEAWGGRSANRGQCAQACRLPYQLLVDGALRELGDVKYLLSPQDLCGLDQVPALIAAGVGCLKIEGRLKGVEYVAATTAAYRAAVDSAWAHHVANAAPLAADTDGDGDGDGATSPPPLASPSPPPVSAPPKPSAETRASLAQVFARGQSASQTGLTPGFLAGINHQTFVVGRSPKHRGVFVGTVAASPSPSSSSSGAVVTIALAPGMTLRPGDGLVFDAGAPEAGEEGGAVTRVRALAAGSRGGGGADVKTRRPSTPQEVEVCFQAGSVSGAAVRRGHLVWRSSDPALEAALRRAAARPRAPPPPPRASARLATIHPEPSSLSSSSSSSPSASDAAFGHVAVTLRHATTGCEATAATVQPLAPARSSPTDVASLLRELGGLEADGLELDGPPDVSLLSLATRDGQPLFLPAGQVKAARRRAAAALRAAVAGAEARAAAEAEESEGEAPRARRRRRLLPPPPAPQLPAMLAEFRARLAGWDDNGSFSSEAVGVIRVLCRTPEQAAAAAALPWLTEVGLDFLEAQGLAAAVRAVQGAGKRALVATPRVLKPTEQAALPAFYSLKLGADALLVRSAGMLHALLRLRSERAAAAASFPALHGDTSLNAVNTLSCASFLRSLSRLAPGHDASAAQLCALARSLGPAGAARLEVVAHAHLPVFHTEHCVFARLLSDGTSIKNCGSPCERHSLTLVAPDGRGHTVLADAGCRNTVFSAAPQSGAESLAQLSAAGVGSFRVELLNERASDVGPLLDAYHGLAAAAAAAQAPEQRRAGRQEARDSGGGGGDARRAAAAAARGVMARWGAERGSLETKPERERTSMKATAAAIAAAAAAGAGRAR